VIDNDVKSNLSILRLSVRYIMSTYKKSWKNRQIPDLIYLEKNQTNFNEYGSVTITLTHVIFNIN